jgi:hypothetical protein
MEYKSKLQQMQEDFEQHKAQKPATSGYVAPLNPAPPYYPPYQHPCPSCGRCPHCGRGGWVFPSGPQWTLTGVMASAAAPSATIFPTTGFVTSN